MPSANEFNVALRTTMQLNGERRERIRHVDVNYLKTAFHGPVVEPGSKVKVTCKCDLFC